MPARSRALFLLAILVAIAAVGLYPRRYAIWYALDASAAPKPPVWTPPVPFANAPPAYRQFFLDAKKADAIADPLARCLAFPDLPGTQWPAGLAAAQCRDVFGPTIPLETLRAAYENGDYAAIDALFASALERHFTDAHDEIIHRDYLLIGAHPSWDQFTQRWLQAAPDSAFAHAARGRYLEDAAANARGDQYAADTAPEAMRAMSVLAAQGIDEYQRALAIEPRLLPAHAGLITLATLDSRDDIEAQAIASAAAIDPDCYGVAVATALALAPKWGGDPQRYAAYIAHLDEAAARRPLLALAASLAASDVGDALYDAHDLAGSQAVLEAASRRSSAPHVQVDLARAILDRAPNRFWDGLVLLIAASRYQKPFGWYPSWVSLQLLSVANDHEWALAYIERAAALEPDNAATQEALANTRLAAENMRGLEQTQGKSARQ